MSRLKSIEPEDVSNKTKEIFEKCFEKGLIINCTQRNILRLMPALNVTKKQANKAIHILEEVLKEL